MIRGRKGEYAELFRELQTKGYARARVDGTIIRLEEPPTLKKYEKHDIEVIVDRLAVKDTAAPPPDRLGRDGARAVRRHDHARLRRPRRRRPQPGALLLEHLYCPYDDLSFEELEPRSFSFNSPFGACPECTGLGTRMEVDPELVVPDPEKTLGDGAITPWSGGHTSDYFEKLIEGLGNALGFTLDTPWEKLTKAQQKALLHGHDEQVHIRYSNRFGRQRSYYTDFDGVIPWIQRRHAESESDAAREKFEGYMREIPCPACKGRRLKPVSLAVTVGGTSIADVSALSIGECAKFLAGARALRARHAHRRAGAQGDQRPAGLPARRRASTT